MGLLDTITDPLGINKKAKKALGVDKIDKKLKDPFGYIEKLEDKAKDALGYDFEKYNFKSMWDQVRKNPLRILAPSPLSTKVWNEVTGRDDDPIINQLGGPSKQRYIDYIEQGGDPSAAKKAMQAHQIAATIASIYAGGALGPMVGGMMGGVGAGAGAAAGTTAGGLAAAVPASFTAGLSGAGALGTAAVTYGAAEADALFDEDEEEMPWISRPAGSFNVGNVPGLYKGGLAHASRPRQARRYY